MTHQWTQTISIDEDVIKLLLLNQFNLKVSKITLLGEGWDNGAYLINNEYVFRFPRREFGVNCIVNEIALLPYLASKISFKTTCPIFIGQPCENYPYSFSGYRVIQGKMLAENPCVLNNIALAEKLASWLDELHNVPLHDSHIDLPAANQSWRLNIEGRIEKCSQSIEQYKHCFEEAGFKSDNLLKALLKFRNKGFSLNKKSYVHGDIYSKHIMVDEDVLPTGLIDWGDVHIGHPGIDLSGAIMIFDKLTLKKFYDCYKNLDDNTIIIASFRALCHSLSGFPYFYQNDTESSKKWAHLALVNALKNAAEI